MTKGYRTSEFWLTVSVIVGSIITGLAAITTNDVVMSYPGVIVSLQVAIAILNGIVIASYNLSRGIAKGRETTVNAGEVHTSAPVIEQTPVDNTTQPVG